jgi:hypothetical protein
MPCRLTAWVLHKGIDGAASWFSWRCQRVRAKRGPMTSSAPSRGMDKVIVAREPYAIALRLTGATGYDRFANPVGAGKLSKPENSRLVWMSSNVLDSALPSAREDD